MYLLKIVTLKQNYSTSAQVKKQQQNHTKKAAPEQRNVTFLHLLAEKRDIFTLASCRRSWTSRSQSAQPCWRVCSSDGTNTSSTTAVWCAGWLTQRTCCAMTRNPGHCLWSAKLSLTSTRWDTMIYCGLKKKNYEVWQPRTQGAVCGVQGSARQVQGEIQSFVVYLKIFLWSVMT